VQRGGHWGDLPSYCRSAFRGRNKPNYASHGVGFRVVCLPQERSASPLNP
jgi:formylglycine-generating enzyme required for sulfatase activity